MKLFLLSLIILFSTSVNSIERPGAVEPQLDEEDNPTYYMTYGKGCLLYTSPSPRD